MRFTHDRRSRRSSIIITLVGLIGLVFGLTGSPASADVGAGEITFEGTAHLPVFPAFVDEHGHFYGSVVKGELAGEDATGPWHVEARSTSDDHDLYAGFTYSEDNCEVGTANGKGWLYVGQDEGDEVNGEYDGGPVTSVYAEFDFTWDRVGNAAVIVLTEGTVNVWLNPSNPGDIDSPPAKTEAEHDAVLEDANGDPDHSGSQPTPIDGDQVITGHQGAGEAAFAPLNVDTLPTRCDPDASLADRTGDLHAEVGGEAQVLPHAP